MNEVNPSMAVEAVQADASHSHSFTTGQFAGLNITKEEAAKLANGEAIVREAKVEDATEVK